MIIHIDGEKCTENFKSGVVFGSEQYWDMHGTS